MKIIIKNRHQNPVFTLDVETGTAEVAPDVSMDAVATEFLQAVASALKGGAVRDIILASGGGENPGNLVIRTGDGAVGSPMGEVGPGRGGDHIVQNRRG